MTIATIAVFRQLRRLRVRVEMNGQTVALRSPFVLVSNNRYSGRVLASGTRPCLDAGRLWIYTTRARRRLAILGLIWQSLFRRMDRVSGLDEFEMIDALITRDEGPLPVAVDGELVDLKFPLRFRIRPRALLVIAPNKREAA
jgi:diacylglycerol kinase family enzyme